MFDSFVTPMDCSPPDFSVHGISQAGILEWVAISSSRGSSRPRDWTGVSCIGRWILNHWASWEAPAYEITHPLKTKQATFQHSLTRALFLSLFLLLRWPTLWGVCLSLNKPTSYYHFISEFFHDKVCILNSLPVFLHCILEMALTSIVKIAVLSVCVCVL